MGNETKKFEDELNTLKETITKERRSVFLEYCNEKVQLKEQGVISTRDASNRICGICSLFFETIMPEFEEVMDIACDLELPDDARERPLEDWGKMVEIIKNTK